jgi:hypothetical protein
MGAASNPPGTWLQRAWWRIRDLYRVLKPCRFTFIVALLACPIFSVSPKAPKSCGRSGKEWDKEIFWGPHRAPPARCSTPGMFGLISSESPERIGLSSFRILLDFRREPVGGVASSR